MSKYNIISAKSAQSKRVQSPIISVILPVYNGQAYLKTAIESILNQTFTNFELIVIDDGSTDQSDAIIKSFSDQRIRHVSQKNRGLAATLNRGIRLARGTFIARQDQDDISHSTRFREQIQFLNRHPRHAMVGSWAHIWKDKRDTGRQLRHPEKNAVLKFELLFNNPFVHSSIMIRKSVFDQVGGYTTDPKRQPPEDYELWSRVAEKFEVANIPKILLTYRSIQTGMSRDQHNPFTERVITISSENIAHLLNRKLPDKTVQAVAILAERPLTTSETVPWAEIMHVYAEIIHRLTQQYPAEAVIIRQKAAAQRVKMRYHYPSNRLQHAVRFAELKLHQLKDRLS